MTLLARMEHAIAALPVDVWDTPVEDCGLVPAVGEDFARFAWMYARVHAHMRDASGSLGEGKVPPMARVETNEVEASGHPGEGNVPPEDKGEESIGGKDGLSPKDSLILHMQKKLVGWILRFIWEGLDFQKLWCTPNDKGQFTSLVKQGALEVNNNLAILCSFLGRITKSKQLRRIAECRLTTKKIPDPKEAGAWVYARVNMNTGDMYIGETTKFQERFEQHLLQTFKHSKFCKNKCTRCKAHTTYNKHQVIHYSQWIMVAVYQCETKFESLRVEHLLQQRWKPSIGEGDTPFWMLKQTYKYDQKKTSNLKKPPPKEKEPAWKQCKECQDLPPDITTLVNINNIRWTSFTAIYGKGIFTDLGAVLRQTIDGETCSLQMVIGKEEMTNWASIRKMYGTSRIRIYQITGEEMTNAMLKNWANARQLQALQGQVLQVEIAVKVTRRNRLEEKNLFEKGNEFIKQLQNSNEEELADLWKVRSQIHKESRIKYRTLIWDECERRYPNVSRKPISIRLPYFRELDADKVKRVIREIIESKPWPDFLKNYHKQKSTLSRHHKNR